MNENATILIDAAQTFIKSNEIKQTMHRCITRGTKARVQFDNARVNKKWLAYCKENNLKNNEELEY